MRRMSMSVRRAATPPSSARRRAAAAGSVAVAVAVALAAAGAPMLPTTRAQGELEGIVFLPLVWRTVQRGDLPPAPVVPTVRPPTATPTLDAPPTAPPTFTPEPSTTPTPAGDGFIGGRLLLRGQPAPEGLGDGFGPGLFLLKCTEGRRACERVGRTAVVGEEGRYRFQNPPALADNQTYVVHWRNETFDDLFGLREWLGSWYSEAITPARYTPGAEVTIEDIELEPIELTGPSNGTGYQGLPWTFTWDPREHEVGSYRWAICDCFGDGLHHRDTDKSFKSPSVGRTGAYQMNDYPQFIKQIGIGIEHKYFWYVHVDGPRGSWGQSHDQWMLWFIPGFDALRPLGVTGFARVAPAPASRAQTDPNDPRVHLPFVWRGAERADLPAAPAAPTAPPPTAPPAASATPTDVPPTDEPTVEPTAPPTPTSVKPMGTIRGRYVKRGQPLPPGYGADSLPQIELRVRSGGTGAWRKVANAVIGEDGAYAFESPPPLQDDQVYQVWWINDETTILFDYEALGRWYSRSITPDALAAGADIDLGTVELRDLELKWPENDIHYSLPHDYRWETRDEVPTENYRWSLYKTCTDAQERFPPGSHRSSSLGHVNKIFISSPPQGFKMDERYCWYVTIEDSEQRGSGWTYFRYKTIFLSAVARLDPVARLMRTLLEPIGE